MLVIAVVHHPVKLIHVYLPRNAQARNQGLDPRAEHALCISPPVEKPYGARDPQGVVVMYVHLAVRITRLNALCVNLFVRANEIGFVVEQLYDPQGLDVAVVNGVNEA